MKDDEVRQWLLDNYIILTEWVTNIVMIRESGAKQTPAIFQDFEVPIMAQPPFGFIQAGNDMKSMLIMQAVFGVGFEGQTGDGVALPNRFPSFKQVVGRLPMQDDVVLFTATRWFELTFNTSNIISLAGTPQRGHSVLRCRCTIDAIPKEVGQA